MLKIGEKIKELRKAQDVTQEKLADYLNISYQAVSKWENGLALPDITLVPQLANFFGVTCDYLLGVSNVNLMDHRAVITELGDIKQRLEEIQKYLGKI